MGIYIGKLDIDYNKYKERISYDGIVLKSDNQLYWGYGGSGPQYAGDLILEHHLGKEQNHNTNYKFTMDIISNKDKNKDLELTSEEVEQWCKENEDIIERKENLKSIYEKWISIGDYRYVCLRMLEKFMQKNNIHLDIYETNPYYAIRSAFEYWMSNNDEANNFNDPIEAFDYFFEKNKNNDLYFSKDYMPLRLQEYIFEDLMYSFKSNYEVYAKKSIELYKEHDKEDIEILETDIKNIADNLIDLSEETINIINEHITRFINQDDLYDDTYSLKDAILRDIAYKHYSNNSGIVKKVCEEIGLTYKQLSEAIGVKEQSLRNMTSSGKITEQVEKSLNLLLENHNLKEQIKDCNSIKKVLRNLTK